MLPKTSSDLVSDFEFNSMPSYTYKMDMDRNFIRGHCSGLDAIKQAIYKILNTERYENIIYSWNYGVELKSLYGREKSFVIPELKRRITEALIQDDRINKVDSFEFTEKKEKILTTFTVHTDLGNIESELEVDV